MLAETQVEIPQPLQDAAAELTRWVIIGAITIPLIILAILILKLYAQKLLIWIADKITDLLNRR